MIKECNETDLFVLTKRKYRKPGQKVAMCFVSNCVWCLGRAKKESGQMVHRFYQHYWGGEHDKKDEVGNYDFYYFSRQDF